MINRVHLTRQSILDGTARAALPIDPALAWSDEQILASLDHTLAAAPPGDIWLFAYGSLMWNPCIEVVERIGVTVQGWHRSYCLWSKIGRGTPSKPGLMLALDRGGRCHGIALRVRREDARAELEVVWRREMVAGSYHPRWVSAVSPAGRLTAIAFTMNRTHPNYAGRLTDEEIAHVIATARGRFGTCAEYLFDTHRHLVEIGLVDPRIARLVRRVQGLVSEPQSKP
ncbi:MAG: gamma-glutamylcyclotransferase [Alphaproteobacteria bacterium]|nr:gamma-glutamylcyclotransferase [Alphaproteobacteria bacterium]TAD91174.1 MAG: gamma-glutamylcyclotransferase [Alphaproteobacteria bacterium]